MYFWDPVQPAQLQLALLFDNKPIQTDIHISTHEASVSIRWRTNNWFSANIKTCINDHRRTCGRRMLGAVYENED